LSHPKRLRGKLQQFGSKEFQLERNRSDSKFKPWAFVFGFRTCANLCPESTVPMHPHPHRSLAGLFLDFRALCLTSLSLAPHFFGQHDSPSNLAESSPWGCGTLNDPRVQWRWKWNFFKSKVVDWKVHQHQNGYFQCFLKLGPICADKMICQSWLDESTLTNHSTKREKLLWKDCLVPSPARAGWLKRLGLVWATPWADFVVIGVQLCSTITAIFPCVALSYKNRSILRIIADYWQPQKRSTIWIWVQLPWAFAHYELQHRFFVPKNCTILVFLLSLHPLLVTASWTCHLRNDASKKKMRNASASEKVFARFSGDFLACCSLSKISVFGWTRCKIWPWHNPLPTSFSRYKKSRTFWSQGQQSQ